MYSRFILVYSRENTSQKFQFDSNYCLFTETNPQEFENSSLSNLTKPKVRHFLPFTATVGPAPNNGQRLQDQHSYEGNDGVANDAKQSVPPAGRWLVAKWEVSQWVVNQNWRYPLVKQLSNRIIHIFNRKHIFKLGSFSIVLLLYRSVDFFLWRYW